MVFNLEKGILRYKEYLYDALKIDVNRKNIISFVGAGGKSTSIYSLGKELVNIGKKVIIITTTHMERPKEKIALCKNIDKIGYEVNDKKLLVVGELSDDNKIIFLNNSTPNKLISYCDFLLIEADGSKKFPIKAPENHEPVIVPESNMVIAVVGMDGLGKKIKDVCHRPHAVCKILKVNDDHIITIKDISVLLSSKEGQMKNVVISPKKGLSMEYRAIVNKADNFMLLEEGRKIVEQLEKKKIKATITTYKMDGKRGEQYGCIN